MIELKYLSKTFQMKDGAVKALQNINLTIPDGAIYGIIGMSGKIVIQFNVGIEEISAFFSLSFSDISDLNGNRKVNGQ